MTDHTIYDDVRRGMIPAHIYNDEEIFALERERLFSRAWIFVGHESEIPQPGDYVVRRVLDDSFIVVRDESGSVKAMFNMCLHRGMQVCRAEMGNASHFRCPYHGWSYRNDGRIVGLPFHEEAYGGEAGFNRKGARLLPAPSLDSYNGLIFISMDPDAPPLIDYLGDFAFYLDYYTKQSSSGIELRGPQRWRVKANWKIGAENFAGDMYHTPQTHTSVVEIGLFREPKAEKRKDGNTYWAGNGGGTTYKLPEGTLEERLRYVGYPDEMIDRPRRRSATCRRRVAARTPNHHGRRVGLAHTESGDLPMKLEWEGEEDDRIAAIAAADERQRLEDQRVGAPISIANEFSEIRVSRVETRNGSRLLIESPRSGQWVALDPLELEALTWQTTATFSAMIAQPFAPMFPEITPEEAGEE